MTIIKKLSALSVLLFVLAGASWADNGINSPYSRFGLGLLADQNLGINRQMGGLGYAMYDSKYINLLNPASIAHVDTLTMLFEAGFSLQNVNFKENGKKINAHNGSFDYIAMEYRIRKGLGMSLGFLPYSNVGYSFSNRNINTNQGTGSNASSTNSFNGTGGMYQPYVALAWAPFKNFSIGLMGSYLYGDITHSISTTFDDTNIRSRIRNYTIDVSSYKLDFGMQYDILLKKGNRLTLGAVYSLGHDLNAEAQVIDMTSQNSVLQSADTTIVRDGFKLPHTIGIGVVYSHKDKWKFGIDYTYQSWGSSDFFGENTGKNRSKISLGAEYTPNEIYSRNLLKKLSYRAGAYYAQPYTQVNGEKGCEEYGISAGFSLPIVNKHNNRSYLHVSGQVIRMEPKSSGLISETYLRLNLGITFNEGWFTKMKVE